MKQYRHCANERNTDIGTNSHRSRFGEADHMPDVPHRCADPRHNNCLPLRKISSFPIDVMIISFLIPDMADMPIKPQALDISQFHLCDDRLASPHRNARCPTQRIHAADAHRSDPSQPCSARLITVSSSRSRCMVRSRSASINRASTMKNVHIALYQDHSLLMIQPLQEPQFILTHICFRAIFSYALP